MGGPSEFAKFVGPILAHYPELKSIEWAPLIRAGHRKEHESQAREEGIVGYQISEIDSNGVLTRASVRSEYFPAYYVEPASETPSVSLGLDLACRSGPLFNRRKLAKTAEAGEQISVLHNKEGSSKLVRFLPVHSQKTPSNSDEDISNHLRGFVLGFFKIDSTVEAALKPFDLSEFDIFLWTAQTGSNGRLLYSSSNLSRNQGTSTDQETKTEMIAASDLLHTEALTVGDQQWMFIVSARSSFLSDSPANRHWIILVCGITITILLSQFVYSMQARTARVGALVDQRTHELQRSERSLHNKNLLLARSQEVGHWGSWELDLATKELEWSDEVFRIFGLSPKESPVTYEEVFSLVHPDDRQAVDEAYSESVSQRKDSFEIEHRIVRNDDGEVRIVHEKCSHEMDEYGEVVRSIGLIHDITQRKQAENELRKAQDYISNIINSMPSILVGVDAAGNVTHWNTAAQQAVGTALAQATGRPLAEVFPRLASDIDKVREAMENRRPLITPKRMYEEAGETRYEDVTVFPLVIDGANGAVIRIDDVSERVRIEEMMVQSEKILSLGGLAAGMAHEINNPLAGMVQTADVLSRRLTNKDIPANIEAAKIVGTTMDAISDFMEERGILKMLFAITDSGRRVAHIVDNMLSFSRKATDQKAPRSIPELVDKALDLAITDYDLKKHYDFKLVEITKEYAPDLPPVMCEAGKLQQVMLNVLRNGAQAMQEGGTRRPSFTIRTSLDEDGTMARIEIEDNGPGMSENVRKHIFEPFFTTKREGAGTGLGLSVSYFIVTETHGGKMAVESALGKGTKFIICLPI